MLAVPSRPGLLVWAFMLELDWNIYICSTNWSWQNHKYHADVHLRNWKHCFHFRCCFGSAASAHCKKRLTVICTCGSPALPHLKKLSTFYSLSVHRTWIGVACIHSVLEGGGGRWGEGQPPFCLLNLLLMQLAAPQLKDGPCLQLMGQSCKFWWEQKPLAPCGLSTGPGGQFINRVCTVWGFELEISCLLVGD